MKKLAVLLVVLGLLAVSLPVVAKDLSDLTVADTFWVFAQYDLSADPVTASSAFVKARIAFDVKADEFNQIYFQLKGDTIVGAGTTEILWRQAYLKTDLGAALKLPFGVKTTVGYFDTYFTNWSYVSMSAWEFYYDAFGNQVVNYGQDKNAAFQLDTTFGPVNVHWYNDFLWTKMAVGADAAFGPVTAYLAFGSTFADLGSGLLTAEAKYSGKFGDLGIAVPVGFKYKLDPMFWSYSVGVAADYKMFHLAAGFEGDDTDALDNVVVDASIAPMEGLKAMVSLYLDLGAAASADQLAGVVIEIRKKIGVLDAVLGYAISDAVGSIPVYDDGWSVSNGLYGGFAISY